MRPDRKTFRRMPPPNEEKLGTRIHDKDIDEDVNIIQCPNCENWVPENEVDDSGCPYCPEEDWGE